MGTSTVRVVACGSWASHVLEHVESSDPALVRGMGRLQVSDSDTDSAPALAHHGRVTLVVPSESTYRAHVGALTDTRRIAALLPAAWLADPLGSLSRARTISERLRCRMALLAAEPRLRARMLELVAGADDLLILGAPDEPLASAGLLLLGVWAREAISQGGLPARLHLVIGLDPLGERALAAPAAAARLHAFLCELDAVRAGVVPADGPEDPFDRVLTSGNAALSRPDLAAAAAEVVGWWLRGAPPPPATRHADDLPPRWRGRSTRYAFPTALTAALDLESLAIEQARPLADVLARRLGGDASRTPPAELAGYAERIVSDVHAALRIPSEDEIARLQGEPAPAVDPALGHVGRLDRELERLHERTDRTVAAARAKLLGGAIQRMTGTVEPGQLDLHVTWLWKLVETGRATLSDTAATVLAAAARLQSPALERAARDAARGLEEALARAEKRRRDGAPASALAALHAEVLRLSRLRAQVDSPLLLLADVREMLGRAGSAMASARASTQALPRLVAAMPRRRRSSPWQATIRLDADVMRKALGADEIPSAWLREQAAGAPGDPMHGLGRPAEALAESLVAHVGRRIADLLRHRPVQQFHGLGAWVDGLVASLPPASGLEGAELPRGVPQGEAILLAGVEEPQAPQPPLSRPATLLPSGDPARVGWIHVVAPVPLAAVRGLAETRRALDAARLSSTLLPHAWETDAADATRTRFRDPAPGDLLGRVRAVLAMRGQPDILGALADASPEAPPDAVVAALRTACPLTDEAPSFRQAGALAAWDAMSSVSDLAGIERMAHEASACVEPDGSDAELLQALVAVASVAEPVKKALESTLAQSKLTYLTQAADGLGHARPVIETRLAGLERRLLDRLLNRWGGWLKADMAALRGRSELEVRLRTRRLIVLGHARVVAEVENVGDHPALAARIELLASPAFRILDAAAKDIGPMAPHERRSVEFLVKPLSSADLQLELVVTWDDLESAGKRRASTDAVHLLHELPAFRRIERNPYIAGPPVRSEEMFFGRDDVFAYIRDGLAGRFQDNILILHGQRRTGKSSILCQIERRDILPEHVPVLVDLQGLGSFDTSGLLYQLARHASRRVSKVLQPGLALPPREGFAAAPYDAFQEHLDVLEDVLEQAGKRLLVMIDEFDVIEGRVESGAVEPEVFPFLRNLMQHRERIAFVLAGTQQLVEMRHDYWSILFSLAAYRKVSYLPAEAARELVQRPLQGEVVFDDLAVDSLLHLTAGHPYYLQLTCQNLVHHLNGVATRAYVTPEDLQQVLPEVLTAGSGHFEHEWRVLGSPLARCVLAAMAERDDTGLRWYQAAELAQIVAPLRAAGLPTRQEDVEKTLEQLVARDAVEASADATAFRVRIDLLRQWVRRSHPLARAMSEAAESLA